MTRAFVFLLPLVVGLGAAWATTVEVSNFPELQEAVQDMAVDIIDVMNDITFASSVGIRRQLTIRAQRCTDGDVSCTVALNGNGVTQLFSLESYAADLTSFHNLNFTNGAATAGIGAGGALYVANRARAAFNACSFHANSATFGGAVYMDNGDPHGEFTNCTFSSNSAVVHGADVYLAKNATAVFLGASTEVDCSMDGVYVTDDAAVNGACSSWPSAAPSPPPPSPSPPPTPPSPPLVQSAKTSPPPMPSTAPQRSSPSVGALAALCSGAYVLWAVAS